MLVLRRNEGQWVEVTHKSGDTLRFRVYDLGHEGGRRAHLAFDDPARNFSIQRPERRERIESPAEPTSPATAEEALTAVPVEAAAVEASPA